MYLTAAATARAQRAQRLSLFVLILLPTLTFSQYVPINQCRTILDEMIITIENMNTYEYKVESAERVDGEFKRSVAVVKAQNSPFKIYMKVMQEDGGPEILYAENERDGDVLITPNGFPYFNLKLDPDGWIMRKDRHHNIKTAGFHYVAGMMKWSQKKAGKNYDRYFKYLGDTVYNGNECSIVMIDVFDFQYEDYTIQKGERIDRVAERLYLNDYMIVDKNEGVDGFTDVKEGQVIKIPSAYGRKIILFVHKQMNIPFYQEIHDENGLYESYSYEYIRPHAKLSELDFSPDNPDYGF